MRTASLATLVLGSTLALLACESDGSGDDSTDGSSESSGDANSTETSADDVDGDGDGDGDGSGDGDGDGDAELPVPSDLPVPTGACPSFVNGNVSFAPAQTGERTVKLWVGDNPQPGGLLVIYWHAYGSVPEEAAYAFSQTVIDAITAAGGVVAAPYPADDVGEFPWFVVNGSQRPDDMLLGDEIVACALQDQVGVDPRRIHSVGMSAGGLQTVAFTMARSRYIASATSFSGGAYAPLPFEDPSNRFAAMVIHGGDSDIFGGAVNFKTLSLLWLSELQDNGNFTIVCDHGGGHTLPTGWGADIANFFFTHPFGTEPSPYAEGLPSGFPDACSL